MNILGFRGEWIKIMKERMSDWEGYACVILSEDSNSCTILNDYISDHWENLDARSGDDLLIFAVGDPTSKWLESENERYSDLSSETKESLQQMIDFYSKYGGRKIIMAEVHIFLDNLQDRSGKKQQCKLPAIMFFQWKKNIIPYVPQGFEPIENDKNAIQKFEYNLIEMPRFKKDADVEKYLFKIIKIAEKCREENKNNEEFIKKVDVNNKRFKFVNTTKNVGRLLAALWPYRKM